MYVPIILLILYYGIFFSSSSFLPSNGSWPGSGMDSYCLLRVSSWILTSQDHLSTNLFRECVISTSTAMHISNINKDN